MLWLRKNDQTEYPEKRQIKTKCTLNACFQLCRLSNCSVQVLTAYLKVTFFVGSSSGNSGHHFPPWKTILQRATFLLPHGHIHITFTVFRSGQECNFPPDTWHEHLEALRRWLLGWRWQAAHLLFFWEAHALLHPWVTLSQQGRTMDTCCCQSNFSQQLLVSLGFVRLTCKLVFIQKQTIRNAKKKAVKAWLCCHMLQMARDH